MQCVKLGLGHEIDHLFDMIARLGETFRAGDEVYGIHRGSGEASSILAIAFVERQTNFITNEVSIMTSKETLVEYLRNNSDVSKNKANELVSGIFDTIVSETKKNGSFGIVGFGTFKVADTPARTGRNPQTGEPLKIAASKRVSFHAGKPFKDAVRG